MRSTRSSLDERQLDRRRTVGARATPRRSRSRRPPPPGRGTAARRPVGSTCSGAGQTAAAPGATGAPARARTAPAGSGTRRGSGRAAPPARCWCWRPARRAPSAGIPAATASRARPSRPGSATRCGSTSREIAASRARRAASSASMIRDRDSASSSRGAVELGDVVGELGLAGRRCGTRRRSGRRAPRAGGRRTARTLAAVGSQTPRCCRGRRRRVGPARRAASRRRPVVWPQVADDDPSAGARPGSTVAPRADTARPAASATAGSRRPRGRRLGEPAAEVRQRLVGLGARARRPAGWPAGPPGAAAAGRPARPARCASRDSQKPPVRLSDLVADDDDQRRVADRRERRADREDEGPVDDHLDVVEPVAQHGDRRRGPAAGSRRRTGAGDAAQVCSPPLTIWTTNRAAMPDRRRAPPTARSGAPAGAPRPGSGAAGAPSRRPTASTSRR